jgi:hypothetical protein
MDIMVVGRFAASTASVPQGKNDIYVEANVLALDIHRREPFETSRIGDQGSIARIPIVIIFPLACCALPVSGQAAAPPTSPMNSRRFIRSPARRAGKQ